MNNYKLLLILFCLIFNMPGNFAQDSTHDLDSYQSIGDYPEGYKACNIFKRLIDGLAFRYYWATDSLRSEDLEYKPTESGRTSLQTLQHINDLSYSIDCFFKNIAIERRAKSDSIDWHSLRNETLTNFRSISDRLTEMEDVELYDLKIRFKRGEHESEFPFWHIINGQISDALYHVGQVVSNRRASYNPIDPNVNVFIGTSKE